MWSGGPPTLSQVLFAQLRFDFELVIYAILLVMFIIGGCMLVVRIRRWREDEPASEALGDQLAHYHQLVERGELAQEEFERIKARLEQKAPDNPPAGSPPRETT